MKCLSMLCWQLIFFLIFTKDFMKQIGRKVSVFQCFFIDICHHHHKHSDYRRFLRAVNSTPVFISSSILVSHEGAPFQQSGRAATSGLSKQVACPSCFNYYDRGLLC